MRIKILFSVVFAIAMFVFNTNQAAASPENENKAENNPQVVAYFPEGEHGIVGETEKHTGSDLVMRAGDSGVFQQWFLGESGSEGYHGEHSVWVPAKKGECSSGWQYIPEPYPGWGDYFEPGVDYCVHTNDFALGQGK